ncbi:MAG: hypothetical protein A3E25_00330 [Burkholderiales bacterium RIFCSPHIGHO2_12_FULL_69_20]|nr:MAG: hypothetical protein A3E25_00330 [Burkholderiales bacterium RIFCSPHIGHO2_12_FULL_69_20]
MLAAALAGCASGPAPQASAPALAAVSAEGEAPPQPLACPGGLPAGVRCLGGQDRFGAHYLIALPARWSGVLVLHAHGGPALGAPKAERSAQDLKRWQVMLKMGHAWAGSSFRQGGVEVRAAAEDTERLRRIFVAHVDRPTRTVLHGQSWGAGVAAVGAEQFATAAGGRSPYDAVLLSSGVLAGGTRSYDFRLDLRLVYQQLCGNHPAPGEADYPLWMGLPPAATLTRAELAARVERCLGLKKPAAQRSALQQQKLSTLLAVIRIPERSLLGHLNWATWHFQDIVQHRTGGLNPFGNRGVHYRGSGDDEALNRAVPRYAADPQAVARLAADTDPGGRIPVPVLTVHAIDDPVAFVELSASFRATMARGGSAGRLVQTFTRDTEHSYLSDAAYATLMAALLQWIDSGRPPTAAGIDQACAAQEPAFGAGCRFDPAYQPQPLEARVPARLRP